MAIKQLNPYLIFDGTAGEAIKLYETALGAKTESVSHFSDVPGGEAKPETKDRVVHALLRVGAGTLMISDNRPEDPPALAGNVHVCLDFEDAADMETKFTALAVGGKIAMPPQDTFWGARFGMLTDAFGIQWMLNCTTKPTV
jgi:PhnB protein